MSTSLVADLPDRQANTRTSRQATLGRKALYWASTLLAAFTLAAIGATDVMRTPALLAGLAHLGYPAYFATIIGVWKLLGAAAILAPGRPLLKEWAYAGFFFTLTGAAMSHAATGDPIGKILFPLVLLALVMTSRRLLPARRSAVRPAFPAAQAA